ncbi:MAG TPA: serine hydrolase domain-containing protein [Terracidiphilus sp.]|nr:serine hydrolase domain-containing protein [Terracidiphilus sp.]
MGIAFTPTRPKELLWAAIALSFLLIGCIAAGAARASETAKIDELMTTLSQRGQFNGAILVAVRGEVIYRKGFGKADFQTGANFTPDTSSNIGSLTKQFTAMAIMILAEQGKLNYDDPVSRFIPEFSHSAHLSQITLRQLLNHTSGIPDYGDLGVDDSGLDPQGLIAALIKREDLLAKPGLAYRYSNPGYALLGIVVGRVSGMRFGDFLEREIFAPAGMINTFVYDRLAKKNAGSAVGYSQFGQADDGGPTAIPGDGGIYSTVNDLSKWDQALYTDKLVSQSTLAEAFTPGKVQNGTLTYGFGWNVAEDDGGKYLWHSGSNAGFRAFISRRLVDKVAVIILTNKGNSKRQEINAAIQNILADRPYVLPKQSGAEKLYEIIHESGIRAALEQYRTLKRSGDFDLGESELNTLGYQLLYGDKRAADAVAIFKLNAIEHPVSSNAFDSLGEAYRVNGENNLAVISYRFAMLLDPSNGHSAAELKKLKLGGSFWLASLTICGIAALIVLAIVFHRKRNKSAKLSDSDLSIEEERRSTSGP